MVLLLALGAAPAVAESRYALVIGNAQYAAVPSLRNSVADARAMRRQLEAVGFTVTYREDADRRTMNRAVDEFVGKLSTDSVALFYYAGHGVQIGSANMLIPTDLRAETASDVANDAIDLTRVLERVTESHARFALAIIDACRDNPFAASGRALGVSRGLAPTTTADGVMVVYSAGANQTALDRLSDRDTNPNGVFTREWLQAMALPGIPVQAVATQVRQSVATLARSVGHVQTPAVYDQSLGTFEFLPASATAPASTSVPAQPAQAAAASASLPPDPLPAQVPVQDCDRLAQPARKLLGRLPALADGVPREGIDVPAAQAACARAMAEWPAEARFAAYAGRVADRAKDTREAVRLFRIAAGQGNAVGQYGLAHVLDEGTGGVARDQREAARLYHLAADQGYPSAQVNLGLMYVRGLGGLPHDEREAVRLWKLAVEQGDADAQTNLAVMHAEGRGGLARNPREAVRLWRLSAAEGDATAQRNLRRMGAAAR